MTSTLSTDRLREIELAAVTLRERIPAGKLSPDGRRFDVRQAVGILLGARVASIANLRHQGRRVSGLFTPDVALPTIRFEAHELPRRQRFTIAHECGHACLDPDREPVCSASPDDEIDAEAVHDLAEAEADAFAASFLVPANLLSADLASFGPGSAFLADLYDVTPPAMRLRLRDLQELNI